MGLSTHVLDTMNGCPAAGMEVALYSTDGDNATLIKRLVLNHDGRTDAPLFDNASLRTGTRLGQGQAHPVCVFFWGGLVGHDARASIVTQRVHHIQGVDHAGLAPQGEVAREVVEDVERAQGAREAVFVGDVHG